MKIPTRYLIPLQSLVEAALKNPNQTPFLYKSKFDANMIRNYHGHMKRCLAEESVFSLDPNDPLFGWGALAHQYPKVIQESDGRYAIEIHTDDELHPTAQMYFIRAAAIEGVVPTPYTTKRLQNTKVILMRPKTLTYPALQHRIGACQIAKRKDGVACVTYDPLLMVDLSNIAFRS